MTRTRKATDVREERAIGTTIRVAGYVRVSTDKQKASGLGLADQRLKIASMCALKDWPEAALYVDEGLSGAKESANRPQLRRLLADVEAGQVDVVIINSIDRLSRKARLTLELAERFRLHGVALVSCKETLDTTTPAGQLFLGILAVMAQFERDLASERTRATHAVLRQTTGDMGGRIPYGYVRRIGEKVVSIDLEAAATVRRIFGARRRGHSLRIIALRLNRDGVPAPRGGSWRHTTVASILRNRAIYTGGKRANSAERWPAILGKQGEQYAKATDDTGMGQEA